ncbi:MAG: lytic transglycosylase domain-containing protein [Vicinamibacterales bacterium]
MAVHPTFDPIIRKLAAEGVDAALVRAVIQVESAYQPRARSTKGAVGLMQVLPSTARQDGIRNLYDPTSNIRAGVTHLKTLLDSFSSRSRARGVQRRRRGGRAVLRRPAISRNCRLRCTDTCADRSLIARHPPAAVVELVYSVKL